jgi:hypothetical protein
MSDAASSVVSKLAVMWRTSTQLALFQALSDKDHLVQKKSEISKEEQ